MDKKISLNEGKKINYDMINQSILEEAILIKMASEIRALNFGIIPKMDVVKQIHLIEEPKWNEVRQNQVIGRIFRK
jgi:hypothetical protein